MKKIAGILTLIVLFIFSGTALANQLHPVSGAYYTSVVDLRVAARGVPMVWERTYRSNRTVLRIEGPEIYSYEYAAPSGGPLGAGWYSPFFMRIQKNAAIVSDPIYNCDALVDADGRYIFFPKTSAGVVQSDNTNGYTLNSTTTGYTLTQRGGNTWTFDTAGRLLTIADPLGRAANLVYSGDILTSVVDSSGRTVYTLTWEGGRVSKVTDLAGRSIQYQYDGAGNLATVKHEEDTLFSYGYNASHGLTSNSNAIGETWTVTYRFPPNQGIAASLTQPDGGSITQQFDSRMSSVTITKPGGASRTQTRNDDGQLVSEKDSTGLKTTTVAYLGGGVRVITDADGNSTKEYRNDWDEVTKRIDAEGGSTVFSYNSQGKQTSFTDAEGITTTATYDGSGVLPTQIVKASGTADQSTTTFSYSGNGDVQSTTVDGSTTGFTYNDAGLPLTVTDPEGGVTTNAYDLAGNLTSSTDGNGNRTEYTYDWRGNMLTAKDGEGNLTTYAFNLAGRMQSVTDPLGRVTTTSTDYSGKVTAIAAPAGTTSFEYDRNGNMTKVTRGDAVTSYTYDTQNRLTSMTDPEGYVIRYGYSNGGTCSTCSGGNTANTMPTVITDQLGGIRMFTLDKLGRVKQFSDPMSNVTRLQYDKVGRITTRTDANGNATTYTYDALGRIKSQTDAEGGVTSLTYDKSGNLLSVTDPENNTTTFAYDLAGRKVKELRPEGQTAIYTYYANGLLKTVKDAKGQVTTYSYDKAKHLVETVFADGTKHTFSYDKAGNMTGYASPDASGTITYDAANRKTGEIVTIGGFTKSYSYAFDGRGNKSSFTTPEGTTYNYSFNKNGLPTQITTPAGNISLAYQWVRQTKVTLPNGVVTDYSYNESNWLTQIQALAANQPATFSAAYGFDKVGNITGKTTEVGAQTYGYDRLYQLTSATIPALQQEAYGYDKAGNRKTSAQTEGAWSYNKNNELLTHDGTILSYDANGNTITKSENGAITTYNYGATNRLTSVQLPDGRTATYKYDPFGRRVSKQVGAQTTYFLYANEGLIGEYGANGIFSKGYAWRPNCSWETDPVLMVENGRYYFYHNDHLGTPQKMTDVNGAVVWSATYDGFGDAAVDSASTVTSNWRLPGQYFDEETGLHYNFQRYYDPETGRYVEQDPLGILKGKNPLYAYVKNNPVNLIDPLGLFCSKATPAPANVIGDCEYYRFRAMDFNRRNGYISEDSYYLNYGYKYCLLFNNVTKQKLSKAGQDWVDATTRLLQEKLEAELAKDSNLECCGLREAAFASHPDAYIEGGLTWLGLQDKWTIMNTVEKIDWDAAKQIAITFGLMLGQVQQ